jgi:electron transfer flavoprotein alpha/beta subunit
MEMHIIVCLKQVPDTEKVKINPETNTLVRDGVENIMNPYDEEALETALLLKDNCGATVTVVSMGPDQAKDMLKQALALGADEAVLLSDRAVAGSDTLATSVALKGLVDSLGAYDLILCGRLAVDGSTAQVGPELAEHLGIPQITGALKVTFADGKFTVVRENDTSSEVLEVAGPALITMTRAEKELRFASIKGKMKARKAQIPVKSAADLKIDPVTVGLAASPTQVLKIFTPEVPHIESLIINEEDPDKAVDTLMEKLISTNIIKH